jgi:hypothetical protein
MTAPVQNLKMNAAQFNAALTELGLNQVSAASFLGLSVRTTHGYANGFDIPVPIAKLLRVMVRLKLDPADVR